MKRDELEQAVELADNALEIVRQTQERLKASQARKEDEGSGPEVSTVSDGSKAD